MRPKWALAVVLASVVLPATARGQSPQVTAIQFPSDGATVHGRFFSAASDPLATLVLLPGADFDDTDVLDLGRLLSARDVNVVTFAARGTRGSEGSFSFANAIDDVGALLLWLRSAGARGFDVDPERIAIGGHSLGGGIAMAFAAHDTALTPLVSIAGNDLGEYARRLRGDATLAEGLRARLARMKGQAGFAGVDPEAVIREILDNEAAFGHVENAASLARRPILLLAGWDDATAPIETVVLPVYRALRRQPASDVTIIAYADDHSFRASRERMASDVRGWLVGRFPR